MGKLVDHRRPDLVGKFVGIREVGFEREAEERDPIRAGRPARPPFGARHALVKPVERLVGLDVVVADLVGRRFVGHDDRDFVECCRERLRDRIERNRDQLLERAVARDSGSGVPDAPAALGHGDRILGAWRTSRRRTRPPIPTDSWSR
jgi:hypothetical protein